MKKSGYIELVLVAIALSSCHNSDDAAERKVYMRSDSTANYTESHGMGMHGGYYAFRPYGVYSDGGYRKAGYYSSAINKNSNIGSNAYKGTAVRGGFGRSSFHVSS